MKGSLTERSPADVLSEVQRQQASGVLRLVRGQAIRQIFVDAGVWIRFAASTFPNESMTALFKGNGVTDAQIRQATASKQAEELLGTTLVRLGSLERQTLTSLTEEHIRQVLHGALLMHEGDFEFQAGALPFREQLDGGMSVSGLLLEWVRDVPDASWVRRRLPEDARVRLAPRPPEGYQKVPLNPAEGYTMSRVDGAATVREICIVSPMGEETTLRALLGLALAGLLEMPEGAHPLPLAPPPSAAARPAAAPSALPAGVPSRPAGAMVKPTRSPAAASAPSAPARAAAAPAVLPNRTPGNGGGPKATPPRQATRKAAPAQERVRPSASADLEGEMLARFEAMRDQDLYQVLGVPATTSGDEVRRAYYGLAKRFHPDRFQREEIKAKAEKVFAHITEAYSTLSHADSRQKYDEDLALRKSPRHQERATDTGELARQNFRVGREQFDKGKFGEALGFFQNACDQDPSKPEHFYWLALTQSKNPRWKKDAEANFLKAIEIDPTNADCYAALGALYVRGGVHSKAKEMFKKALQWDPANATATEGLATEEGAGKKGLLGLFGKK
jgi:DnaJ-domain-containing protein 1